MEHRKAELRLALLSGVGPRLRQRLLEHFGTAENVFRASRAQLQQVKDIGEKLSQAIYDAVDKINIDAELERFRQLKIRLIFMNDPEYPPLLKEIYDPPSILFVKGKILPEDFISLAVVGTRHATHYGQRQTKRLVEEFVRAKFSIISGLARGIDAYAHRAALEAGGRTIAVLGHGLAVNIYPPENAGLAENILRSGGALVTEFSPFTTPSPGTFPQRNRIISGMSLGTVVVEAGLRSGASITAKNASEQGREVFAVPGPVDSRASAGCHKLIRDGAKLIESVEDVLDEITSLPSILSPSSANENEPTSSEIPFGGERISASSRDAEQKITRPAALQLSDLEKKIIAHIPSEGCTVDLLAQRTETPIHLLVTTLTMLEMKRLVKRSHGQQVFKL
ncbi:MAG: DNA-processing protein DprA [Planctomycetia bacterium]|nr:DNA-processing protein DprA [Planctomycetia bacterium]